MAHLNVIQNLSGACCHVVAKAEFFRGIFTSKSDTWTGISFFSLRVAPWWGAGLAPGTVTLAWSNFLLGGCLTPERRNRETNAKAAGLPRILEWMSPCMTPSPSISNTGRSILSGRDSHWVWETTGCMHLGSFSFKSAAFVMEKMLCVYRYISVFMGSIIYSGGKIYFSKSEAPSLNSDFWYLVTVKSLNKPFVFLKLVSLT